MKKTFIIIGVCLAPYLLQAQIGGMLNRAKNKIQNKIDNGIDKAIDGKPATNEATASAPTPPTEVKKEPTIKAFSKYDFVAGEKIIYADDFAGEAIGELPASWTSNGKGTVVTLDKNPGNWLRLFPGMKYFAGSAASFGENYTVEFDLLIDGSIPSGTRFFPSFTIGMFGSLGKAEIKNELYRDLMDRNLAMIAINPNADAITKMQLTTRNNKSKTFESANQVVAAFSKTLYKPAHYALQVQKERIRVWVDDIKVFDIPSAINTSSPLNQLFFSIADYWPYHEDNFGMYLSNIRVATGLPDSRHKLIEEGKFSTTGILFDVNSATIKAESAGIIKEIATALADNPSVKIKITGHTDADGDDKANLALSARRALAVKEMLAAEFAIEAGRMETDGKGELLPVADNKTNEGKARNRRVEFIKI